MLNGYGNIYESTLLLGWEVDRDGSGAGIAIATTAGL